MTMRSESLAQIVPALIKAQALLKPAAKSATNPHLKNKYATLADVWDACRDALKANELAVVQAAEDGDHAGITIVTTLYHGSGEWIASRVRMPLEKATAQSIGSAISYGRRYGLASLLGVVNDEDDDGNAASGTKERKAWKSEPRPETKKPDAFTLPGKPESWGGFGGKPLDVVPVAALVAFTTWCEGDEEKRTKYAQQYNRAVDLIATKEPA